MALRARSTPSASGGRFPRHMDEEIRQRHVDPVANQPPHAGGIIVLPLRIHRQRDLRRPAGHGAGRQQDRVAHRLVAAAAAVEHPGQHRHVQIGIVIDADLALAVVQPVQAAHILGDGAPPRNGQRQKQRVEPRVVEAFANVFARGQQHALFVFGDGRQAGGDAAGLLGPCRRGARRGAESRRQSAGQVVEMFVALGQHQRRTAFPDGRRLRRRSADCARSSAINSS